MSLYYNKNAEWKLIHSAYGVKLKGKRDRSGREYKGKLI